MRDFALVTEGVTDHVVLKNILGGFFKPQRELTISPIQPDPHLRRGSWHLVFEYLREKKFRDAFQLNHFLIIQIDTDVSQEKGFDVPHQDENGTLPVETLVERVIDRLKREIGEEDLAAYEGRFIFAISVDEIECWLLPLWYSGKARKNTGCLTKLGSNPNLRKELRNLPWISKDHKEPRSYEIASREYRKPKVLREKGPINPSLDLFLKALATITLPETAD